MQKQIDEVMGLVDYFKGAVDFGCPEDIKVAREDIESKLRELLPVWQPMESAPFQRDVLAVNGLGYIGRAYQDPSGRWNHIGKPIGWMPLPKAPEGIK